jgi:hypothetical protein
MGDEKEKLDELFGMLKVIEDDLPNEEDRSKTLIDNLNGLHEDTYLKKNIDADNKTVVLPEGIVAALNNLKRTIKLFNLDVEYEKAGQFKLLEKRIDTFIDLFHEFQEEKDLTKRTELSVKINDAYQNINTYIKI